MDTEKVFASSTMLAGDGMESPYSQEFTPLRVLPICRASSACVQPRASLNALIFSAIIRSASFQGNYTLHIRQVIIK